MLAAAGRVAYLPLSLSLGGTGMGGTKGVFLLWQAKKVCFHLSLTLDAA